MRKNHLITATILIVLASLPCIATDIPPTAGTGTILGYTFGDEQHPARMTRQIAWRYTHNIHFVWNQLTSNNFTIPSSVTMYQAWDKGPGTLKWSPVGGYTGLGGKPVHPLNEYSKHPGIDAMSDGRGLISNGHETDGTKPYGYYPKIWADNYPLYGSWGYQEQVPNEYLTDAPCGGNSFSWPYISFQIYDNGSVEDTIIHILSKENCSDGYSHIDTHEPTELRYFRRLGGPHPMSPAHFWDNDMIIDVTYAPGYVVEASSDVSGPLAGKVAIAWIAHWPEVTGDAESATPIDFATVKQQSCNDIYIMESDDGGASWSSKYNITKNDSLGSGWVPLSDISAIIDTDGRVHIVYAARRYENTNGGLPQLPDDMNWPQFPMASRILHWSDEGEPVGTPLDDNYISVIKDMHILWDNYPDVCTGGLWNSMSLTKPMISQCDDKLYVLFSQYQDPLNGVTDNCHISRYNGSYNDGAANGTLHLSISSMSNGGLSWDPARMLTDFTPRCDTAETYYPDVPVNPEALSVCHNHGWPSMARYGMLIDPSDDFYNAVVINDPSWSVTESPDYYLDVLYVDDLYPGSIIHGEGCWTVNPMRWFRIPCMDEEPGAQLAPSTLEIYEPDYNGGPGEEIIYPVVITNIGNVPTDIVVTTEEIDNVDPAIDGWLYVDLNGFTGTLSHIPPNNSHEFLVVVNHNGIVDNPWVPTTLQGNVVFSTPTRSILYELPIEHAIPLPSYICGDIDGTEGINILDIVFLINYIYKGGPTPNPLEAANIDGVPDYNILDIVYLINFVYKNGPDPIC